MTEAARPEPWGAFTTPEFWDDPHISSRMLGFHLAPDNDMASRRHEFIDASVAWLVDVLDLDEGSTLLDLGCGPGLYANRLAARGVRVTGVDVSGSSLAHARQVAAADGLPAKFVRGDYLTTDLGHDQSAAIMIYEDYCALSPAQRAAFLARVSDALADGGRFAFDVTSAARFAGEQPGVRTAEDFQDGFWGPPGYVGTEETFTWPEHRLVLYRYTIERDGDSKQFWNWMHCLTPDEVADELTAAGFEAPQVFGDVAGAPYDEHSPTFAVVARKA
ncbi:SAM-dependent methyltransferase [Aestuariimicrobium ganziense]|uniref:SAM-dependent methyltransferase n=1 Tax=Aestuariimicrobium ganziense TaxID=2773677 RepID=UPI001945984D|nr:class I SAM-dependent methyltransferase [Aestuariimicrobium ganziense]